MRRLGVDAYEAILRSGAVIAVDEDLLKTLPHGEAKLATLTMKELMGKRKSKATASDQKDSSNPRGERHAPRAVPPSLPRMP